MQLPEIVYDKLKSLPEPAQKEVLEFVEFLEQKSRQDERLWSLSSLASALQGLESDVWPVYEAGDLKEDSKFEIRNSKSAISNLESRISNR
jgi:hypothetical protein